MAEEFAGWSRKELLAEIKREEEVLTVKQADLATAEKRRSDIESAIRTEGLTRIEERFLERAETIRSFEAGISERQTQIDRYIERLRRRALEIGRLEQRILELERSLPRLRAIERFITRGVIEELRRTIRAFQGWQTRDSDYLSALERVQTSERRSLARVKGWQTREEPTLTRLIELRDSLTTTIEQIASLSAQISTEQTRLEIKKKLVPPIVKQLVHAKIIIYTIVSARPPKKYTKRFQAFFNVDAIRNIETGEIDYSAKLTQREIDECMDVFYALWNWGYLPPEAQEPKMIESGVWEEIDDTKGADIKEASVRENEEETFNKKYRPPEIIYSPSKKESEELLKLVRE